MNSIRRTLFVRLLAGGAVAALLGTAAIYYRAYEEANALFDYQLEQMAFSLRERLVARIDAGALENDEHAHSFVIQIWNAEGTRLYLSHSRAHMPARVQLGFSNVTTPQGELRVFGLQSARQTVQVAQPMSARRELAAQLALRTLTPVALLLPLVALLIWITVGQGLAPLLVLTGELRRRAPGSLAPLAPGRLPEELQPMVAALNDLLTRLERAMQSQRDFVADAAHELRTPLAAVRLQAQNVELAASEAERTASLAQLRSGVDRAVHLVHQLLTLARQEPGAETRPFAPVDVAALAREAVADFSQLAAAGNVDLGLLRDDPVTVPGDAVALRTLLSNLLDNAIRYTPAHGRIDVCVSRTPAGALLEVLDTGPGIAADERDRVFDRFYRAPGNEAPGSGLGLAIVKNIAGAHGASVTLGERGDARAGLRVGVSLLAAAPAQDLIGAP